MPNAITLGDIMIQLFFDKKKPYLGKLAKTDILRKRERALPLVAYVKYEEATSVIR